MIKIEMTGLCKDCLKADLVLDSFEAETFDTTENKIWEIRCIHEGACERIFKGRANDEGDKKNQN